METFENSVTIRRPAKDVFAFLAEFENVPRWNHAIDSTIKSSAGPVGVGSTYRQIRSQPRSEEVFEVTAFEPAAHLGVEGEIGPFHARLDYRLEPIEGGTRLLNLVELEAASVVSKLLAPLAASRVKAAVAENLDSLRRILESDRRSSD
ncbi:MAG TPA: SRPBCC family protein [Actinomycetota bacterium]|nr:SRPBCC family protein [Actinomycetota bacterium]